MAAKLYPTKQETIEELASDLRNLTRFDEDFLIPGCISTMIGAVDKFPDLTISSEAYKSLKMLVKTRIETLEKHEGRTKKKFSKQFSEDYELLIKIEEEMHGPSESSILTQALTLSEEPSPHHALQIGGTVPHRKRRAAA